ncbi:hypothetical protein [Opitutus terrae]|uniref:Uncharacterized protein n=1 Tax=Opitutus terrae (strain DSM 11246 / JCM 15787 / PB90-1) TaxID=452637 RepID=B1ZWT5_OPITP|nr:hypothetical protein [Opitutus terrae]ACB74212.1 hypothetical protein Oter_0924 [Opitutus terrae PB90-1]
MRAEFVMLLGVVGGLGFVGFIFFLAKRANERGHQNLEQLARRLGLTLPPQRKQFGFWPNARGAGLFRGKPAELYAFTTGSGKSRERWVALALTPKAAGGLTFRITRQGFGSRVAELFGAREITIGDPAFDDRWFIQTNQPEFFAAALIPELRARLNQAVDASGRAHRAALKLENASVVYAEAGDFSNDRLCERLARIAEVVADLADVAEVFAESQSSR